MMRRKSNQTKAGHFDSTAAVWTVSDYMYDDGRHHQYANQKVI